MKNIQKGDPVLVINSHGTRAYPATVDRVSRDHVEVWNSHKEEYQYFGLEEPHEALGDYWTVDETRPRLVPVSDPVGAVLARDTRNRAYTVLVQGAVRTYSRTLDPADHARLKKWVDDWPTSV